MRLNQTPYTKQRTKHSRTNTDMNTNPTSLYAAGSSPAMRAFASREHSPSPRQRPFPQLVPLQQINSNHTFTVTPASARSASSVSPSPYLSSLQSSPLAAYVQDQQYVLPAPIPFELPESVVPSPPLTGNRGGLMRKLSCGAKNVGREFTSQMRRLPSSSNQSKRAQSSGPVARRRSDSKTTTAASYSVDPDFAVPDLPQGLGLNYTIGFPDDLSDVASIHDNKPEVEVVAPAVPEELVAGCVLTKSTRKKKTEKYFFLDKEGTRVSWSGTVSVKSFHIDNIKSIRTGDEAKSQWHAVQIDSIDADHCFTINYTTSERSNDIKTLHLIAHSRHDLSLWVDTLDALAKHREDMMTGMMGSTERYAVLKAHWDSEIRKSARRGHAPTEGLNMQAITSLCRKLHIHCPKDAILVAFEQADEKNIGLLNYEQFRKFVRRLRERSDITPIFNQLKARDVDGIHRRTFVQFLQEVQGIDPTSEANKSTWDTKIEKLISKSSCTTNGEKNNDHIDFGSFAAFLSSQDCRIYANTERTRATLDRPLSEYFIYSSHNTYLLGRQVNGTSSVEAYVTALRRGCRSVEIDCWNGENNNPRVTHGFTRTTSVNFEDVCHAINRCAFEASPYPIILSLEVHCNPLQQLRMVEIMTTVFGDKLLLNLLSDHPNDLPSPEELKYRILVKVKATEAHPNLNATTDMITRKRSTSSPYRKAMLIPSNSSLTQPATFLFQQNMMSPPDSFYSPTEPSVTATSASSEDDSDAQITSPVNSEPSSRRVKTSKITPPLAILGIYLQGYTFRDPKDLAFQQFNHVFSLNESTAATLCKDTNLKRLLEEHNVKHMCRVYPKGIRVNSSNFDPNTFWRRGVQMVALNFQTYDVPMQMNHAMFATGTDQSGYVLKPEYLRRQHLVNGPFEHRFKSPRKDIQFSVQMISAQQLPRLASMNKNDSIDPFIEVQMFSAEDKARGIANGTGGEGPTSTNDYHGIGSPYSRRTRVVRDNGYNPQFNDTIELTLQTKYPELVFVRFIVYQAGKNSRQLAVFTSKLDSLQCGYRHVPLSNSHGEELIFSTLFCKITKRQPMLSPNALQDESDRTPRQRTIRGILSRNMSMERGRQSQSTYEEQRLMRWALNREIEESAAFRS